MCISNVCVWICVYACMETVRGLELVYTGYKCAESLKSENEYGCSLNGTDGSHQYIVSFNSKTFTLKCNGSPVFEYTDSPHMNVTLDAMSIKLQQCPPPTNSSYAQALAAFNVRLLWSSPQNSLELAQLPPTPPLTEKHFDGFDRLAKLSLSGMAAQPSSGFLSPLRSLRSLKMKQMHLPAHALNDMPTSLSVLILKNTSLQRMPDRMPNLTSLTLKENQLEIPQELRLPRTLTKLILSVKNTTLQELMSPALEDLTLDNWPETDSLEPLTPCDNLKSLHLESPAVRMLPDGWLNNCKKLTILYVRYARHLSNANTTFLRGATELTHVKLISGALEYVTEELFREQSKLISIDLQSNKLHTLPSSMFSGLYSLDTLNLSSNDLDASIWDVVGSLESLTKLDLSNNRQLGVTCRRPSDISKLSHLNLMTLILSDTNITHICVDWRQMPTLENLHLDNTPIVTLQREDLQCRLKDNGSKLKVRLRGAKIKSVEFNERDYEKSGNTLTDGAEFILENNLKLNCDCRMYWTRLALDKTATGMSGLEGLRCGDRSLRETRADEMLCPAAEACQAAGLPGACRCAVRPARGARLLLRVTCAGAALRAMPRLRAAADWLGHMNPETFPVRWNLFQHDRVDYEMLLQNNIISSLSATDLTPITTNLTLGTELPLQHRFVKLDLTHNNLTRVHDDAVTLIKEQLSMRVLLAHNPLDCDCGVIGPLMRALSPEDLRAATCLEGGALDEVKCGEGVPPLAWGAFALLVLLLLCATVAALLGNRERQLTVIVLLHKIGLMRRRAERDEQGRPFDAFVSFSHEDEKIVRELVERLESGPTPYRLCLHYRDWVPGRFIPDQIVESVRRSRRTVALVSRHFLESTWACAEFREAYAHAMADLTPRLVVVLLEEAAALPLDPRLRRYLRSNTYVRWGDQWFWDKLELALPKPRPPPELALPPDLAPPPELAPPLVMEEAV